jgi:hypothetical protein
MFLGVRCVFLAANHRDKIGLEAADSQRLAAAFNDKLGITQPAAIDVSGQQIISSTLGNITQKHSRSATTALNAGKKFFICYRSLLVCFQGA